MTLPPWISQQYSDIQYSDPYRQPKEPDPPRHINAYQVLKKMGWSDFQQIHQAQAIGFPKAFAFETKKVGGGASRIGIYMEDKIDDWREHMAVLINATLK